MTDVEVTATAMAAGGDALAREPSGRVVFVAGALPGERVRAHVVGAKRDFAKAVVAEVLDPSPDRVAAPCPAVARGCGGCQWQHAAPEAQARYKADVVADALRRIARLPSPPLVGDVATLPAGATRTTVRVGVVDGRAAFHRRASSELVPVDTCLVAHPLVQELLAEGRFGAADEVTLRVSAATGERMVVVSPSAEGVRVPAGVAVVGPGDDASFTEVVGGRGWRVSARSFFQAGPEAANLLLSEVAGAVGERPGRLVDAYAGVGLLGGALAPDVLEAIESAPPAVADARANLTGLDATVFEQEVATWVAGPNQADVVVADPARPGLGRGAAAALAAAGAKVLVLVSCDPASLARDVGLLDELGYSLVSVRVLDLFPHTFHVETVSRFERR